MQGFSQTSEAFSSEAAKKMPATLELVTVQDNTMLHYAAGYGHMAVLEEGDLNSMSLAKFAKKSSSFSSS